MDNKTTYRIMGIDPGTNYMGYGVIEVEGRTIRSVVMGDIDMHRMGDPYDKLRYIFERVGALIEQYDAYGPILQGLNAPINDLSRGCNADEVYKMALITAALI